ncbi:MAG TPA: uroporphyrinogen decarboxylase [Halothiobacillaceae bacterium]|nr:uroporphyrinogen decarboxylase [Halothiobacillaceae bacterium]
MATELKNDRYLKALARKPVDCTPVWIMRQAGRYLPEYRETRARAGSFMELCRSAELACEVTLQPLERYDLDAAILFSDILTIPDAMDLGLKFVPGQGPVFERPVKTHADIKAIKRPDMISDLGYVMNAVSTIRKALNGRVPLIGFTGSPWTLATYMVEGGTTKDFAKVKGLVYSDPKAAHLLLDILADSVIDYLNAQIEAGAQSLMVFDTWGGVLAPHDYREFSLRYMQKIVDGVKRDREDGSYIPVVLFTKGGGQWAPLLADTGADGVGIDWTADAAVLRAELGDKVAMQGNLDPSVLYAPDEVIRREVKRVLDAFGPKPGHVFNLGHGIHQYVDPAKVKVLVDAVHELSRN